MRSVITGFWIITLVVTTSLFVGVAAERSFLVPASPILPLIPILGLYWLKPREQLAGWSLFTIWLGSTYLGSGGPSEYVAFSIVSVLAVFGFLRSGWFLAAAWFLHIFWDFVPRDLPPMLEELPLACMIFDGLIGIFLAWRTISNPWHAAITTNALEGEPDDA